MRIASLDPGMTEVLFALNMSESIVLADERSVYPDEARDVPKLREQYDLRDVLSCNPELIVTFGPDQKAFSDLCSSRDIGVIHRDAKCVTDVYDVIRSLAVMFQKEQEGEECVLALQQNLKEVKRKATLLPSRPKVYIEADSTPSSAGLWIPELVHTAGGTCYSVAGEPHAHVSADQVRDFNPDLVVLTWNGADNESIRSRGAEWSFAKECPVRVLRRDIVDRIGPRLSEGAAHLYGWLFEMLH